VHKKTEYALSASAYKPTFAPVIPSFSLLTTRGDRLKPGPVYSKGPRLSGSSKRELASKPDNEK